MEKLTIKDVIDLVDYDIAKEVYAKLVALRLEYIVHNTTEFNQVSFELCYKVATDTIKKAKMTKLQVFGGILSQSKELESLGFTRQYMLEVTGLNIKYGGR